jgi:hypothetical protein
MVRAAPAQIVERFGGQKELELIVPAQPATEMNEAAN